MKPVRWIGSSLKELKSFPEEVRDSVGFALFQAQTGLKHSDAKPLVGFGGASVLEVIEVHDRSTYRAVHTVRFANAVYVLHAFQKKSKKGIATAKQDIDLIKARLKLAEEDSIRWQENKRKK